MKQTAWVKKVDSTPTQNSENLVESGGVHTEAGNLAAGMAILANNNTHAAIASGQYVYVRGHSTLTEGLYTATAAVAANGTLSTSNLTAVSGGGMNAIKTSVDSLNSNKMPITLGTDAGYSGTVISNLTTAYNNMANGSYSFLRFGSNSTDAPTTGSGIVESYKSSANYGAQFVLSDGGQFYRKLSAGTWSSWESVALAGNIGYDVLIYDTYSFQNMQQCIEDNWATISKHTKVGIRFSNGDCMVLCSPTIGSSGVVSYGSGSCILFGRDITNPLYGRKSSAAAEWTWKTFTVT